MKIYKSSARTAVGFFTSFIIQYFLSAEAVFVSIAGGLREARMRLVTKKGSKIVVSTQMDQGETGFVIGPAHATTESRDFRGCVVMACGNGKLTVISSGNQSQVGFLIQKSFLVMPQEYELHEVSDEEVTDAA